MNKNQLKTSNNWPAVRSQVAKCGVLVAKHETSECVRFCSGGVGCVKEFSATNETYHYLGMRWDFTLVNETFSFEIDGYNSKREVTYNSGEVTRISWNVEIV